MGKVLSFTEEYPEEKLVDTSNSDHFDMARKLAKSDDLRFLIGDFFLRLADMEEGFFERPYMALFEKMLDGKNPPGTQALKTFMHDLDDLRFYEIAMEHKKRLRRMLIETRHGWKAIEEHEEWENERACERAVRQREKEVAAQKAETKRMEQKLQVN